MEEGVEWFEQALTLEPKNANTRHNFATMLSQTGNHGKALRQLDAALAIDPRRSETWRRRAGVKDALGDVDGALDDYDEALERNPNDVNSLINQACLLQTTGAYADAVESLEDAIELAPESGTALTDLGCVYMDAGYLKRALPLLERAVQAMPGSVVVRQNRLLALHYGSSIEPEAIYQEHLKLGAEIAETVQPLPPVAFDRDAERPLRIGYLTCDFRKHSVAYFLEPILAGHDQALYQAFAYADVAHEDAVTERMKACCADYRNVSGWSDERIAKCIREDGIDILVELGGHTSKSRVAVTAYRPAPLQMTYLGYPNTTGLAAITHRITDAIADPEGAEAHHIEQLLRLPGGAWCDGPDSAAPAVEAPPSEDSGSITFGCFNVAAKIERPGAAGVGAHSHHAAGDGARAQGARDPRSADPQAHSEGVCQGRCRARARHACRLGGEHREPLGALPYHRHRPRHVSLQRHDHHLRSAVDGRSRHRTGGRAARVASRCQLADTGGTRGLGGGQRARLRRQGRGTRQGRPPPEEAPLQHASTNPGKPTGRPRALRAAARTRLPRRVAGSLPRPNLTGC